MTCWSFNYLWRYNWTELDGISTWFADCDVISGLEVSSELLNSKRRLLVAFAEDSTRRADSAIGLHFRPRKCWLGFCCCCDAVEGEEDWIEVGDGFEAADDWAASSAGDAVVVVPMLLPNETSRGDSGRSVASGCCCGETWPLVDCSRRLLRLRKLRTLFLRSDRSAKLPFSGRTITSLTFTSSRALADGRSKQSECLKR